MTKRRLERMRNLIEIHLEFADDNELPHTLDSIEHFIDLIRLDEDIEN